MPEPSQVFNDSERAFKVQVGALATNDPTRVKTLTHTLDQVTGGRYDSFDCPTGTSYVVPSGKTFYITSVLLGANSAAGADCRWQIGYGDDHVEDSAAAPANSTVVDRGKYLQAGGITKEFNRWIPIPAGKYPFFLPLDASIVCQVIGVEVDN